MALLSLIQVFAVPVQSVTSNEAGKQVVRSDRTASTDDEESESRREEEV